MFDDKPNLPQGQTPPNLPLGEPEDVFAQTEPVSPGGTPSLSYQSSDTLSAPSGFSPVPPAPPSALDAGILKPKENFQTFSAPLPPPPPLRMVPPVPVERGMPPTPPPNTLKEPTLSRGIMVTIVAVVGLVLVGGAFWWVYRYINVPKGEGTLFETDESTGTVPVDSSSPDISNDESQTRAPAPVDEDTSPIDDATLPAEETTSSQPIDETLLFGETIDTDNDGLDDRRETSLQTNPEKADTDNDELSDGDEVIIWGTNPLNPDSDGDSYLDGREIKAGFSPKGPGKLFEVQTTPTASTNATS